MQEQWANAVQSIQTLVLLHLAEWGMSVVGAIVLLVVGLWVARRLRGILRARLGTAGVDPMLVPFSTSLVYWALVSFVIIAVLGIFGVQTASFVVVLGAAGLALGFALQGTLSNFAAGVMLLTFRPFAVGDWVEVGGVSGTVKETGLFSTTLFSGDNVKIVVPNSQVYGQTLKNYSANATRRIDLVLGVGYDDDLQVAQETILKVLDSDDRVLAEPAPTVAVHELGDSSVDFVVRPWCNASDYWPLRWHLIRSLKEELEAADCSIPFPQRDIHVFREAGTTVPTGNGAGESVLERPPAGA